MSVSSYDAVAEKVLADLHATIIKDSSINEFYIIPTQEEENKNSSPILKGENTLGLESWIISHIYPYAHRQIMEKNNYKNQNLNKLIPCLTGVALLNPEMSTVWSKRKELIVCKKLIPDNELRLTRMTLSRKPKCNDALSHRRWMILEVYKNAEDQISLLMEELKLSEMIANHYHSNYHAWSHRMWALQNLLSDFLMPAAKKKYSKTSFFDSLHAEPSNLVYQPIARMELSFITSCKVYQILFEELENNFKWISSHVSDHSGLHFRTFLLSEILSHLKGFLDASDKMKLQFDYCCQNSQNPIVPTILTNGKKNLVELFSSCSFSDNLKEAIDNYLQKLEEEVTLVDIALFLIVTELKSNYSLCSIFLNHEALWCYRKFLVHSFKAIINVGVLHKVLLDGKLFVHQDQNGVPYRKDFKFDHSDDPHTIFTLSSLNRALYKKIISNEEEFIAKASSLPDPATNLIKNYRHWLKHCLGAEYCL